MDGSDTQKTIGVVLAVIAVPLTFLSIFDPLEGGMALLATFALNRVIRVLTGVPTNRLYLWSFVTAFVVGATAIAFAVAGDGDADRPNQIARSLAYLYAGITLFVTMGAAQYAWTLVTARRAGTAASR